MRGLKLAIIGGLLAFSGFGLADEEGLLSKLLAPGPTVKGHAELEKKDCLKCHDAQKGVPNEKCLECHKTIKPFVEEKRGFHGLAAKSCRECHSEHKGRDYDSLVVNESAFEHGQLTGYVLDGKHAELKCAECHKDKYSSKFVREGKTRFFGSSASCVSCHKKDDVHHFKGEWAKKDCYTCHAPTSWTKDTKFDHLRDANYKLVGKHADLKCADCHGPNKTMKASLYKWPALKKSECMTCHADFHKNRLSKRFQNGKCATCHTQNTWEIKSFEHKVTGYPLRGKHFDIKCIECHKQDAKAPATLELKNYKFHGLKSDCLSCHKDYHIYGKQKLKNFGPLNNCLACHGERSWKDVTKFDHNAHTRYPVDGKHTELDCLSCHVKSDPKTKKILSIQYKWPQLTTKTCENCHKSPHLKEFSAKMLKKQCTECHVTSGWFDMKGKQSFNHSQTRFPLTGAHNKISCTDCHGKEGKQNFKFPTPQFKFCVDCHTNIHKFQFSTKIETNRCADCHTTEKFTTLREFDHSQTRYRLEGAHKELKCQACHVTSDKSVKLLTPNVSKAVMKSEPKGHIIKLGQYAFPNVNQDTCLECHSDYHKSQLGEKCLNCHTMQEWKKVNFDHDKQSDFVLRYKHKEVKCAECHKPIPNQTVRYNNKDVKVTLYKPILNNCAGCHKDVHNGSFGRNCQECHIEKSWETTRDFHKNFTLTGVHYSLNCVECHNDQQRRLSGLSQECYACHAKDDVHSGALPNCGECHRQQFWEVTGFKHSLTNFPLRGAHRTLDCMECHVSGTYKGLNRDCYSCHLSEALAVGSPNHSGFGNINSCTDCHLNQFSWR